MLTPPVKSRLRDVAANQVFVDAESALLKRLEEEPNLVDQLIPVTWEMMKPHLFLIYKLSPGYGCHIVRSKDDGYTYNPENDMRGAVEAGLFFTLPDD